MEGCEDERCVSLEQTNGGRCKERLTRLVQQAHKLQELSRLKGVPVHYYLYGGGSERFIEFLKVLDSKCLSMPPKRNQPVATASLMTADLNYRSSFHQIMETLLSHGEPFSPEFVELGEGGRRLPFSHAGIDDLVRKLETEEDTVAWILRRRNPIEFQVLIAWTPHYFPSFESILLRIDRGYLSEPNNSAKFLFLLKDLYQIIHSAFGRVEIDEMVKQYVDPLTGWKMTMGVDLQRSLPEIYWANFLGPEYVEMFGRERFSSLPCHNMENLPDGGILLVLTPTPTDYLRDPDGFEQLRLTIKTNLGFDAFANADENYKGRVPKFRYVEEKRKLIAKMPLRIEPPDLLSTVGRGEWQIWIKDVGRLAEDFAEAMRAQGIKLDFSEESLETLDSYAKDLIKAGANPTIDLVKKVAAYVSQILVRNTNADWYFDETEEIPLLKVGKVRFSPLARSQKVLSEGETFEHWYELLTKQLIPAHQSRSGN